MFIISFEVNYLSSNINQHLYDSVVQNFRYILDEVSKGYIFSELDLQIMFINLVQNYFNDKGMSNIGLLNTFSISIHNIISEFNLNYPDVLLFDRNSIKPTSIIELKFFRKGRIFNKNECLDDLIKISDRLLILRRKDKSEKSSGLFFCINVSNNDHVSDIEKINDNLKIYLNSKIKFEKLECEIENHIKQPFYGGYFWINILKITNKNGSEYSFQPLFIIFLNLNQYNSEIKSRLEEFFK